jgi:hypothetical protein
MIWIKGAVTNPSIILPKRLLVVANDDAACDAYRKQEF